jgi:hypothetical protein
MNADDSEPSEASEPNKKCRRIEEKTKIDTSIRAFNFDDIQHLKRSKPRHFNAHYKVTHVHSPVLTRRVTLRRSSRNSVDDPKSKFIREDEDAPYFLPTEAYDEDYGNVFFFFFFTISVGLETPNYTLKLLLLLAVPESLRRLIEKQPVAVCGKVYCRLGCICSSLLSSMEVERNHCQKPTCILECVCRQRLRRKGVDESSSLASIFFSDADQVSQMLNLFHLFSLLPAFYFPRDLTAMQNWMQSLNRLPSLLLRPNSSLSLWLMKTPS